MTSYAEFLERKAQGGADHGFDPPWVPDFLFPFQASLLDWSIRKGRGGVFADCGLGKTPMELVWAENVVRHTNKPVMILTPLAVARQTAREADKFGVDCVRSSGSLAAGARVVVTNYEKLHHFTPDDFGGVVCDESSAIKAFDGKRRAEVTEFMHARLSEHCARVLEALRSSAPEAWWTYSDLAHLSGVPEGSCRSRVSNLRQWGHQIETRTRPDRFREIRLRRLKP